MSDNPAQDNLNLEVKDFGPIIEAKIDLRPLTVFAGPSNTGKSYLAILIYALHRHFFEHQGLSNNRYKQGHRVFNKDEDNQFKPEIKNSIIKFVNQKFNLKEKKFINKHIVFPFSVLDIMRTEIEGVGNGLDSKFCRCFGLDSTDKLNRKNVAKNSEIVFRIPLSNGSEYVRHELILKNKKNKRVQTENAGLPKASFETNIPECTLVNFDNRALLGHFVYTNLTHFTSRLKALESPDDYDVQLFLEALADIVLPSLVGSLYQPAFYLPAGRTGIMHAHSTMVSALIERSPMAGLLRQTQIPLLSGVVADFLKQLIEIDHPSYQGLGPQHDLGTPIEKAILGGSVGIDRSESIGYPHFTYKPDGWKDNLSMMNASSMVSELAPVVLYLRYMVRPGNVLILEEPESHLHPAMQVEFTRQLAALIHAGIRVIVTTHSEWVLEELANIVRRSELTADARKKTANGNFALEPDQVGAWLFQPKSRPRGSVVKEIRLDGSGLFPSDFTDVAVALHNDWANLASCAGKDE